MIPSNFEYHRVTSVDEAIDLYNKYKPGAKYLAGGHSLLPVMKLRLNAPEHLIDIDRVADLKSIYLDGDNLVIGAGASHAVIADSDQVNAAAPLLAQAAGAIGDVQVRNKGTIGGSLAHADPAADYPAAILACEAQMVVRGHTGDRAIKAGDFFVDLFATALADGEMITEIRVPVQAAKTGAHYLKFAQPASRFAIVGCAALISKTNGICDVVRVGFTGVAHKPFRDFSVENALKGKSPSDANISAAVKLAANGANILNDHFASEEYRTHLARIYAKRALTEAAGKAS